MRKIPLLTLAATAMLCLNMARADITNGLIGHWTFDETSGATAADSSGNNNHAELLNFADPNVAWIPGRVGGAIRINGLPNPAVHATQVWNDMVRTINRVTLNNQNQFTFAFWMRLIDESTVANQPRIIGPFNLGGADGQPNSTHWVVWNPETPPGADASQGGVGTHQSYRSEEPKLHEWRHFVFVYDRPTGHYTLYVDGQRSMPNEAVDWPTANTGAKPDPGTVRWVMGHQENNSHGQVCRHDLDDIRFYNRLLTESDVQELYATYASYLSFAVHPSDAAKLVRDDVTFSGFGDSSGSPVSYQWQKDEVNIPGATGPTLTLTDLVLSDAGTYRVAISNELGTLTSSNAVLTVTALPPADLTNDLVAHWTFDETSGNAAADSSGNGNHATLFDFDGEQWVPGRVGGALRFNAGGGIRDDAVMTDGPILFANHDHFTFSFWVKNETDTPSGAPRFVTPISASSGTVHWVLWSRAVGGGVGLHTAAPSTAPSTNVWHHYVVVYDRSASSYTLYVDGVREVTDFGPITRAEPINQVWTIGTHETFNVNFAWVGLMDDVRIYNRLLTVADVEALYGLAAVLPLQVVGHPADATVLPGSGITLNVEAEGGSEIEYQWLFSPTGATLDEVELPGATNPSLELSNIQFSQAGFYRARVTRGVSTQFSNQGEVTVLGGGTSVLEPLWSIAPGERVYVTAGVSTGPRANLERSLAYNPVTGHVLLNAREDSGRPKRFAILDGATGADLGFLDVSGVTNGGTFVLNPVAAAKDGAIYAANFGSYPGTLSTVYRWANESAGATAAFAGDPSGGLTNRQWGRTLAVRGTGNDTELLMISSSGTGPVVASLLRTTDGENFTATGLLTDAQPFENFPSPDPPNAHVCGAFGHGNTFWMKGINQPLRLFTYDAGAGTATEVLQVSTPELEKITYFAVDLERNLLAGLYVSDALRSTDTGNDVVLLYDISDPESPVLLDGTGFPTAFINRFSAGTAAFGDDRLVAVSANNGVIAAALPVSSVKLRIELSGNDVILSWPASVEGFTLQSTPELQGPATVWSPVPGSPVVSGDEQSVTVEISGSARYYRLHKP
jgi:hypothetical protein